MREYKDQFEPADLSYAIDYINYCQRMGITIDLSSIEDPILFADLALIILTLKARNPHN